MMREETISAVCHLLAQMKEAAARPDPRPDIDRLSDEVAALVRECALPKLPGPKVHFEGSRMYVF